MGLERATHARPREKEEASLLSFKIPSAGQEPQGKGSFAATPLTHPPPTPERTGPVNRSPLPSLSLRILQ